MKKIYVILIVTAIVIFVGVIINEIQWDMRPVIHAKAGQWSEAIPVTKNVRLDTTYGVHFLVRVNDKRELTFESDEDGTTINIPANVVVKRLRVKPDRDIEVKIIKQDWR